MISREDIEKAGWQWLLSDGNTAIIGRDIENWDYLLRRDGDSFRISKFGGKRGMGDIEIALFHGKLSSILELEHVMHWTGIK